MSLFTGKKNYFSLAILPYKVQVLQLNSKGNKIAKADEVKLEKGIIKDSLVVKTEQLTNLIQKVISENKIKTKNVVIGIPEEKVFTKILDLPKMKRSEIDETVRWQAKEFLPDTLEKSYLDWRIVNNGKKDRLTVLIISIPKKIIDSYIKVVDKLDLKPICVETITVSLARLVAEKEKLNIVTEIQPKDATIALCSGKKILASSVISLTGKENGQGEDYFLKTLTKMTNFYENKFGQKVNHIYLCGKSVNKNLRKEIKNKLKKPIDYCPLEIKNIDSKKANNYSIAISLSRRTIAAPEDQQTINLLPPQIQEKYDQHRKQKALQWALWWVTFLLGLNAGVIISIYLYNQHRLTNLKNKLATQNQQISITKNQAQEINEINQKAKQISNLAEKRDFPQKEFVEIIKAAPEKVTLNNFDYIMAEETIRIGGIAEKRPDLLEFKSNLQEKSQFSSVLIPISSLEKDENLDFTLTLKTNQND